MYNLRKSFLLDPTITYLNHGSFGATPRPVFRSYQAWQRELERQPVEFLGRRFGGLMETARSALAEALGARPHDLVYTANVTVSLNIVARSLELGRGDEVLASDHEYGAIDRTWRFLARERGFRYINQPITVPLPGREELQESFWKGVTRRTRVISLSQVTSPTALEFPVGDVTRRARQEGILTVIDGAHVPGQLDLNLDELGADFYGGNLHKWMCAPKGAGFLHAREEAQHLMKPLVVSWGYEAETPGPSQLVDHHEWSGTRDIAAFLSVPAAIEFQREHDWENVRAACRDLARETQERVEEMTGLPPLNAGSSRLQMVTVQMPEEVDLGRLKSRLYDEYHIEVPTIAWNGGKYLRVSYQGYNTRKDMERLLAALKEILQT